MKIFYTIILCVFLFGCSSTKEKEIVTIYEKQKIIKADKILPIYLDDINFEILKIDNQEYIVLSVEDYEKLLLNIEKIKKYLNQQKNVIDYYESEIL